MQFLGWLCKILTGYAVHFSDCIFYVNDDFGFRDGISRFSSPVARVFMLSKRVSNVCLLTLMV